MNKKFGKIGILAMCTILTAGVLAGCGKGGTMQIGIDGVDVYPYHASQLGQKLTDTGINKVEEVDRVLRVDVESNVNEIEFDLAKFFSANAGFMGKNFHFTRDDVKKGDGTLVRGYGWVQTGMDGSDRLYKKMGHENDENETAKTKTEIEELENREGELRMYVITQGGQSGKHVLYIDPTTESTLETGETRVNFKLRGHNGKDAEMKVVINKAS